MATKMDQPKTLAEFDRELAELSIEGHWHVKNMMSAMPRTDMEPWLWRWKDVYPKLLESGDIFQMEHGGAEARRTLRLCTPGNPIKATTRTIHVSVQLVQPHEVAPSHRHSMGAFRFIIQGGGAHTLISGEKFMMERGDLILTPAWTWHDHHNETDTPIIWLDGLDLPLVVGLNSCFFEEYEARAQTEQFPEGRTKAITGAMRPQQPDISPWGLPYRYPYAEALESLRQMGEDAADPFDGYTLDYTNPLTGGPVMPTVACRLHLLRAGQATARHRHTHSAIYHVVEGSGSTTAGDKTLEWGPGDTFVVPMWQWHAHKGGSAGEAVLFSVGDDPVMRALAMDRVEAA